MFDLGKLKNVEGAEVFEIRSYITPVSFRAGELESVKVVEQSGRALRLVKEGRLGYSTSTNLEDEEGLIKSAVESSEFGDKAAFDFPKEQKPTPVKCFDPVVEQLEVEKLIGISEEAIKKIKDYSQEVEVNLSITKRIDEINLANTSGLNLSEKRTLFDISIEVERIREGDIFLLWEWESSRGQLNPEKLADSIINKLKLAENISEVETKPMPVIFSPKGVIVLLFPLVMGFNGKSILLGTSPLKGKLGERVFDRRFSLVDDGTLELASRSCGYDDEGVPTSKKQLIEKGEVKQFLYDLRTAGQAGVSSTGNGLKESFFGGKNFRNPPGIAPTSWVVSEGEMSFEEMVSGLKEGLIVEQVIGLGQGNIMSGEFSNNVAVGYKIEGGEIKGRVKNVMIAGNVYDLLKDKLLAVGDKAQWAFGGFKAPALLIDGVSVVGRG